MSTSLGSVAIFTGATLVATLTRARLGDLNLTSDREMFRAPFGTRWHQSGSGVQLPGVQQLDATVAPADLANVQAALPSVTHLGLGAWRVPVRGAAGPVTIVPDLQGHRLTASFVVDHAAAWVADP